MLFAEILAAVSVLSVVLFVLGVALIVIEMFIPGFGVCGITGIICLVADIFVTAKSVEQGLVLAAFIFIILVILFVIFATLASKGKLPANLVLKASTDRETGFSAAEDMQYLLGKTGVAITALRPAGNADFNGVRLDVVSRGDYIETGDLVEVIEVEGNRIVVKKSKLQVESEVK